MSDLKNVQASQIAGSQPVPSTDEQKIQPENSTMDQFIQQFDPCSIRKSAEEGRTVRVKVDIEEEEVELSYADVKTPEDLSRQFNQDIANIVFNQIHKKELTMSHCWKSNSLKVLHHKTGLGLMVPLRDENGECRYIEKGEFKLKQLFNDLEKVYENKCSIFAAIEGYGVLFTLKTSYCQDIVFLPLWLEDDLYLRKTNLNHLTIEAMLETIRRKSKLEDAD